MSLRDNIVFLLSYLYPQKVISFSSSYNTHGTVWKRFGKNELFVNWVRQSGGMIDELWKRTFRNINTDVVKKARTILVVGVGGASVIRLIRTINSHSSIDLVDIDPKIVDIAKSYFNLDTLRIRNIYCQDIRTLTRKLPKKSYDIIVLDIYIGNHVPDFMVTQEFIGNIHNLLTPKGSLIINYYDDTPVLREKTLEQLLRQFFTRVKPIHVFRNVMFFAGS